MLINAFSSLYETSSSLNNFSSYSLLCVISLHSQISMHWMLIRDFYAQTDINDGDYAATAGCSK